MAAAVPVRVQTRSGFPPSANNATNFIAKQSSVMEILQENKFKQNM